MDGGILDSLFEAPSVKGPSGSRGLFHLKSGSQAGANVNEAQNSRGHSRQAEERIRQGPVLDT